MNSEEVIITLTPGPIRLSLGADLELTGDTDSKRFEVRAVVSNEHDGEERSRAWTDSIANMKKVVRMFQLIDVVTDITVFDRLTARYLKPEDVFREFGDPWSSKEEEVRR